MPERFCKNCGKELPPTSKFCKNCGNKTNSSNFSKQNNNEKKSENKNTQNTVLQLLVLVIGAIVVIGVIFLAGIILLIDNSAPNSEINNTATPNLTNKDNTSVVNKELKMAKPYLEKIELNNMDLRKKAFEIVYACPSGDKECQVNTIYRYIVENYNYRSDPRRDELIQTPQETINLGGGDCEDLTILQNSLLENIGIKTYLVLTVDHAYALACGLDIDKLFDYIYQSAKEQYSITQSRQEKFVLKSEAIDHWGITKPRDYELYADIQYKISSTKPINIYITNLIDDTTWRLIRSGHQYTTSWTKCPQQNILEKSDICKNVDENAHLIVYNPNREDAIIDYNAQIIVYSERKIAKDNKMSYYAIDEQSCFILDPTAGDYGYVGYNGNIVGKKTAFDPITKKIVNLID